MGVIFRLGVSLALVLIVAAAMAALPPGLGAVPTPATHGLSMHGSLKYDRDFAHFAYASPRAPKGGDVVLAAIGTFDTLMIASADEPFSEYGLVAERVETPPDRSWVIFTVRPEARFHDGTPMTADDVAWTFDTLRTEGHPFYRSYYSRVLRAEALGPGRVRFTFAPGENRELPLIVGQMPVLSRRPVVDRLVARLIAAPDRDSLVARTRALDRVLLWGHYVIPHWHLPMFRVAYWNKFGRPAVSPPYALGFETWWIEPTAAAAAR